MAETCPITENAIRTELYETKPTNGPQIGCRKRWTPPSQ